ncbi:MAG TPA: alkaline phosphatase family protein [Bryobacteraceae bacterium]
MKPRPQGGWRREAAVLFLCVLCAWLGSRGHADAPAQFAYIGPGAGFAFLGSFLTLIAGVFLGALSLLLWPFRMIWRTFKGRHGLKRARIRKLIFLGLDGLDPRTAEHLMAEGKMPNLARLKQQGSFQRLRTTFPALSPVAWSTFATGVSPARHNMFDFLNRNLKTYLPELSSAKVSEPTRVLKLGKYRIPLSRPHIEMRRKSRTFWHILGEHSIGSTILRIPITFPPEKFGGRLLSAMCTPDLLGTQGSFALFTTRTDNERMESGQRFPLVRDGARYTGSIGGPENSFVDQGGPLQIPFSIEADADGSAATLEIAGEHYRLARGEYSPWITLTFHAGPGVNVKGIAHFLLTETAPHFSLYMSPINIDPEHPALPISHPAYYANYLAKLIGAYSTLGMAEDTWALNEGAIDEQAFLAQAYLTYAEREAMFLSALERTRRGVVACVFDTTDRVQHMFYRHRTRDDGYGGVIEDLYRRVDELVGKTLRHVDENTVLFVLSDHGFTSFDRGVNLNSWLHQNGYLALQNGNRESGEYFRGIDWSRTRAYTFGLAGVYLNQKGREAQGIVDPKEADALRSELAAKLSGLRDEERERVAINQAWPSPSLYRGPYLDAAPDLIIGYNDGYRSSWEAAVAKTTAAVFCENPKAWSGDHCVDPRLVPGVLFSNRKVEAADPGIEDLAPTALSLFGITPPPHMEGKPLL